MSDNSRVDRVRAELARRADLEQQAAAIKAQTEADERAYLMRRDAALSELRDMLRRAVQSATEFPVEIERITSEASAEDWEEEGEGDWEGEDVVEIAFYKLQFNHVVRESVAEISIPPPGPTGGSDELRALVVDLRAASPYADLGARNFEWAISRALDLVVNALADAIEAGCEVIPPAEGRRRLNERDDEKRRLAEALRSPSVTAPPPAQRESISPWMVWLALAGLVLSIIFRLG